MAHFLLLSPSGLEEDFNGVRIINPKDLLTFLQNEPATLAKGIPPKVIPAYSLRDMIFYKSAGTEPQWKLTARKANVYQVAELLHTRDPILELHDGTQIRSKEGLVYTHDNTVEFFGDVQVNFINGAVTHSQYLKAITQPILQLTIPTTELVTGDKNNQSSKIHFKSLGFYYLDSGPKDIMLLGNVEFNIRSDKSTDIFSDQAVFHQLINEADFYMNDQQPLEKQFVEVKQTDLYMKGRKMHVLLGDDRQLETIFAYEDVYTKDFRDPLQITTSTSGKATYYEGKNEIYLEEFPQVYQEDDTITGEIVVFNRKTDVIEVKQSNASNHQ